MTTDQHLVNQLTRIDWNEWQPVWTIKNKKKQKPITPFDFQEQHSPTKAETARLGNRQHATPRRRKMDARLWNGLSTHQQEAALRIEFTCQLMTRGLGFRTSSPHLERVSGGKAPERHSEYHDHLTKFYMEWATACQREGFSHAAGLDILVFGKSCRMVDTARHRRKGWARNNLDDTLNLYCKMKGWPVG